MDSFSFFQFDHTGCAVIVSNTTAIWFWTITLTDAFMLTILEHSTMNSNMFTLCTHIIMTPHCTITTCKPTCTSDMRQLYFKYYVLLNGGHNFSQTPWPESASELYRPSDRRLSVLRIEGVHVVNAMDPHGHILGCLDRSHYYFFQVAPQLYSRGSRPTTSQKIW
jgi:hypothetical protein